MTEGEARTNSVPSEWLDQIATGTEVGLFLRTPTQMLYMNDSLYRIFGFDPAEVIDNPDVGDIWGIIHPDDYEVAARATGAADRGESASCEIRIVQPGDNVRWIRATNDPVVTPEGEIRVAGTITDITDRKEAEAAMRAAQLEAEHANAAKDEFLSRMSHELRTPLNAVLGFAQLMQLDEPTSRQQDALAHIMRGGTHLLDMINDLLDIANIEAKHVSLSLEPVELVAIVNEVMGLMKPIAASAGIELHLDTDTANASLCVRTDRRRLKQVLLNLLSNAVKYNRDGGRVDARISIDDTSAVVDVRDSGIGIATADLPKLFAPFERLGQETSEIEGTGIGLALCERLVTMMGGRITVTSKIGVGSTFSVALPITSAIPDFSSTTAHTRPVDVAGAATATLLYIEDNLANTQLVEGILRLRPSWTLLHSSTGSDGLSRARSATPTAILLDVHLPDRDGESVLVELKRDQATASIPVAVVSADASARQVGRLLTAGADKYLTKPVDVDTVLRFLDDAEPAAQHVR